MIKITKTRKIEGVTYVNNESRAEAFADDTTLFMSRKESNLSYATKYINEFWTISGSGLASNLDKTNIIPVGVKNDHRHSLPQTGFEMDRHLHHTRL